MMYNPRVYEIMLDRYLGINENEVIFHQYDTESAKLSFTFLENGVPFDIPYTRLVLVVRKPDKKEVYQNIETFSGNTAEIILHNQALTVAGTLKCQIKMYQESKLESTWTFEVKVKPSIGNDNPIKSENEYKVLHQLIQDVDHNIEKNEQAVQNLINETQQSVADSLEQTHQAVMDALAQIDESELVRLKGLIELLQQNKLGVNDKASDSALLNGSVEDVEATAHTIVKRNSDGNIKVGNAIEFKTAILNQKHPVQVIEDAHLKVGNRNVWDDGNLIVETGTFTPYGYGGDNAQQFTHVTQTGKYYKVGRMVMVVGEIVADNFNSATGHFRIGGLPFRIRECHTPCSIGYIRGIKTDSSDIQINVFGELGYAFLQFAMNNTNTGAAWSNVTVDKLIARLGISFSMTYLTD